MKRYILPVIIFFVLIFFFSCYYDNEEALYPNLNNSCDTTNVTYNGTISQIITNYCTGCHSGSVPSGGVNLSGYANVQKVASSGILLNALKGNGVPVMPLTGSFTACKISQFEIWINKGMVK